MGRFGCRHPAPNLPITVMGMARLSAYRGLARLLADMDHSIMH